MSSKRQTLMIFAAAAMIPGVMVALTLIAQSAVAAGFGAAMAVSIILLPLLNVLDRAIDRLFAASSAILVIALLLLFTSMTYGQWISVMCVIAAIAALLVGIASTCRPSAPCIILMLLWLSWPIWLSERLAGHDSLVNWLAAVHPLLAINGQLLDQAIWTERPLMYGWTGLNQDVPFSIPTTVTWCVVMHAGFGVALLLISTWRRNRRPALLTHVAAA